MERYALNETALCGHVTLYGGGASAPALAAQGVPSLMIFARPGAAAMQASAQGAGLLALIGRGAAFLLTTASARAYLMLCGVADVALMALTALADGRVIPAARGTAAMTIIAAGEMTRATLARSLSLLSLDALANGLLGTRGTGLAELDLTGRAGIPHPIKTPATFTRAHASRQVAAEADPNLFTAADSARTLTLPSDRRLIAVAPERNP